MASVLYVYCPDAPMLTFPKNARLSRAAEFAKVKAGGKAFPGKFMLLSVLAQAPDTRIGIITSRKVGNAVKRNRVRRRLREIFRVGRMDVKTGFWIVLIARRAAVDATFESLKSEWLRLAARAGILHPHPNGQ